MSDELKPCPFCGGHAFLHVYDMRRTEDPNDYWASISCDNPECTMNPALTIAQADENAAIEAWNTRALCGAKVVPDGGQ